MTDHPMPGMAAVFRKAAEIEAGLATAKSDTPEYLLAKLKAARFVCAERERELLELKGPCSNDACRLHYAHSGPCDCRADTQETDR